MTTQTVDPVDQVGARPVTSETVDWHFSKPQSSGKMLLLTIGGICVTGTWYGELGESFAAWAPMLKYDTSKFNEIVNSYKQRHQASKEMH